MLLLPIAALAVMSFLLILLLMGVAEACERRERKRRLRVGEPLFCGLSLHSMTDNARLIWATQVPALRQVEVNAEHGIPAPALHPWYAAMARRYPALYEGHSFEEWLEFLEQSRVIWRQQKRVLLASRGHSLLEQCRRACEHDSGWLR